MGRNNQTTKRVVGRARWTNKVVMKRRAVIILRRQGGGAYGSGPRQVSDEKICNGTARVPAMNVTIN